jgi:uncharacterized damage-inducible protein DinB
MRPPTSILAPRSALVALLSVVLAALPASAQSLQSELALDVRAVGEKYVALARAMPADSYDWRPSEGVRSVGEVFTHVAGANLGLPMQFMGVMPPEGMTRERLMNMESQVTDKDEIIAALETAFEHLATTLEGLSDEQLGTAVNVFGRDTNWTGAALLLVTHSHEHLGQAIAYARSNGVTPPWSM